VVEVAVEAAITESLDPPPMACEVVSLQSILVVSSAPLMRSWVPPPPPAVVMELQAITVGESFKAKPPDLTALVACREPL
jgi:hypothetical protein